MSTELIDDLTITIKAISATPIHQKGQVAGVAAQQLLMVLTDQDRRLSKLEGSTCTKQTPGEQSP